MQKSTAVLFLLLCLIGIASIHVESMAACTATSISSNQYITRSSPEFGDSWNAAHCNNFTVNSSRKIDLIVIHTTGASTAKSTKNWFRNGAQISDTCGPSISGDYCRVSAHYLVDVDGSITQFVEEKNIAHHARSFNSRSIGIEHVGSHQDSNWTGPTDAMYRASARLVNYLAKKYGINLTINNFRTYVRGHDELGQGKSDPGSKWDWIRFRNFVFEVNQSLNILIVNPSIDPSIASPGRSIRFNFGISHNFNSCSQIRLGAQIRLRSLNSSTPWIDDSKNDVVISICGPSSRAASRNFVIPSNAAGGTYDVHWVIMDEVSKRWIHDLIGSGKLTVTGNVCPLNNQSPQQANCPPTQSGGIKYGSDVFNGQSISLFQDSGRKVFFEGASSWCSSIEGHAFGGKVFGPLSGQLIGNRCYFDFGTSSNDASNEFVYFNYQNRSAIWVESPEGTKSGELVVVRDSQNSQILNVRIPRGTSSGGSPPPSPGPSPSPSGDIVYGSEVFGNSKISLFQESGRRLFFTGAAQWCGSIQGYAFGGNANNSGPIRGQMVGDRCIVDFGSSAIIGSNDTIWFNSTDGRAIWVESSIGTRSGDLVVAEDGNVRIPVLSSSGSPNPPPPSNPPPSTSRGNLAVQHPDTPGWEASGLWDGRSTLTMFEFNCNFFGFPAILWVSGPNKWQGIKGTQQGRDCLFSVTGLGSDDKVAIGFDTEDSQSKNKAWYYFSRTGSCTRLASGGNGWIHLTPNCTVTASAIRIIALNEVQPNMSSGGVVFDLTRSNILDAQIEIFNLAGRSIFNSGMNSAVRIQWNLLDVMGDRVANGVYLFVITARTLDGQRLRSEIRKLSVVR